MASNADPSPEKTSGAPGEGRRIIRLMVAAAALSAVVAVAITAEPAGGSATPTLPIVWTTELTS